nr:SPOR domain-containing protein [uncultured Neokomagataea sp.]
MADGGDGYRHDEPPRRDDLPRRPLGGGDDRGPAARPPESRPQGRERLSQDYDDVPSRRRGAARPANAASPAGQGKVKAAAGAGFMSFLGSDPATRKLVGGAVGIGAVLLVAVGGWSLVGKHHGGVPIIGPPPGAVREVPADPGGMQLMAGDDSTDMTGSGEAHLAPGPEQPDTKAFARQYGAPPEPRPVAQNMVTAPAVTDEKPVGVSSLNAQPKDGAASGAVGGGQTQLAAVTPTPAVQDEVPAPVKHALPPAPVKAAKAATSSDDDGDAAETPSLPAVRSAVTSRRVSPERERIIRQEVGPAPTPRPAVAAPLPPPSPVPESDDTSHAALGSGHHEVQLAALNSEAMAHHEWETLRARAAGLLSGHTPLFEHTTQGDRSFVRLRIGGFADSKAARAFCVKLHAQSIACTPAQF